MSPRRRPPRWLSFIIVIVLAIGALGVGAIYANAFGAGDRFERLVARVERFVIGPPPADRSAPPTVDITPPPSPSPTPRPSLPSLAPGVTPAPTPTPIPRVPVDVTIVEDPEAVFAHEARKDWCAPAGVQMVLATLGLGDTSDGFQRQIAGRIREWETYADSHNYQWGPAAMSLALQAYGAPGYEVRAYKTRGDALRDAAAAIQKTGSPAVLLAWKGAHTWVMTGFRADADPVLFSDAKVSGAYVLDPWYPWVSSIWGPSDPPGAFQDAKNMKDNFLPWKRPEGKYADRDGKFIVLVPTLPAPG